MKRLVLFLAIAAVFAACDDKDNGNGKLDPNAKISIRAAKSDRSRAAGHLSAREIVEKTLEMQWRLPKEFGGSQPSRGFADSQRDLINERLLMWGTDIISQDGQYYPDFIEGFDMVLVTGDEITLERGDTIAYIPNGVLRAARELIKPAFELSDYATCYKLFDEAFTFIPITGAEWRALKAKDEN